jgi:SAM-dependent methyltransferase
MAIIISLISSMMTGDMDWFDEAYTGTPPWDIGRPLGEFIRLAESGAIRGDVLDVGCGTGENALYLASLGHVVWGIDAAPHAIAKARKKSEERGIQVTFLVRDAMNLHTIGKKFGTVIDSGLFHALDDLERPCFARNLAEVLVHGGRYFMLCFSELEPDGYGPRRVMQAEIRETFRDGWRVENIREARFENRFSADGARAWLSEIVRVQGLGSL